MITYSMMIPIFDCCIPKRPKKVDQIMSSDFQANKLN